MNNNNVINDNIDDKSNDDDDDNDDNDNNNFHVYFTRHIIQGLFVFYLISVYYLCYQLGTNFVYTLWTGYLDTFIPSRRRDEYKCCASLILNDNDDKVVRGYVIPFT